MTDGIKKFSSSIQSGYASVKSGTQRGVASATQSTKRRLVSVKNGAQDGFASVKNSTQSGIASAKSGIASAKTATQITFTSAKNGTQSAFASAKSGISDVFDHTPQAVTSRRSAFSEAFKNTATAFTRRGANLPAFLDGVSEKIGATPKSGKAIGAVRNLLAKATQVGIGGIEVITALGGAFLGLIAGLGAGAKAFATYKKPAAQSQDASSAPDSPASPSTVKLGLETGVKFNVEPGASDVTTSLTPEYVGVTLTPQEQQAA